MFQLYEDLTQTILSRCKFDPETTVLMDFACGNGPSSLSLAPHCKAIVGVNISQAMADSYNKRMKYHGVTKALDLRAERHVDSPQLQGDKLDAIISVSAYKHIDDNLAITRVLKSFIKPKGVLLVVDVMRRKGSTDAMGDMKSLVTPSISKIHCPPNLMSRMDRYVESDMKEIFEGAGLVDFTFEEAFVAEQDGKSYGRFLAKGVCP